MLDERTLDVNEYGVLRIPAALWLGLILQCRYSLFGMLLIFAGQQGQTIWQLLDAKSIVWLLLIEIPALLAIFTSASRRPNAGRTVRVLWSFTALLITASTVGHILYTVWYLFVTALWQPWPEMAMVCVLLIDVVIIYSAWQHPHWKAVLAEFPSPSNSDE